MKKYFVPALIIALSVNIFAQFDQYPREGQGRISGGFGLNWIDGSPYYTFHLTPEVSFANFGVGLDLRLDIDQQGNLRKEDFNEASDYLSIIRYIRYGLKNDPVFIKLGALDYYTLGHGSIMYLYNNSPSLDARKIGLVLDIDFGKFGFESIYSHFAEAGVFGFRGYVRPLQFSGAGNIPILGNMEVGATYAGDSNPNAGILNGSYDAVQNKFDITQDDGSINIIGLDVGFPILRTGIFNATLYTDFTKIINFGSGAATGVLMNFNPLGLITASAKLERRFNGKQYIPSYFNSFYEIERFNANPFKSKIQGLKSLTNPDNGYYGELMVNAVNLVTVLGSYQRLDKTPNSGILHIGTSIEPEGAPFILRAGYDKIGMGSETAIFKLDDKSYLYSEIGYKPVPYIIVSMVYSWTFSPVRNSNDDIIGYQPQKRIEPRISFVFPLDFGP